MLKLAWRELRQGWRHFATFLACVVLGVLVIATIGTLSAAVQSALSSEAGALLGGDVEASVNGVEATPEQRAILSEYGRISHVATMRAMARENESPQVVELKAVDEAYPLLGSLKLSPSIRLDAQTVAVDHSLLDQLNLRLGDRIFIGKTDFTIGATIAREPDRVVQVFALGPRVMLSHEALKRTGLVAGYSIVRHRYRIAMANAQRISELKTIIRTRFPAGQWQLKTGTDGNEAVERFLEQLTLFLTLSGLATFLIGGIGIGSSIHAYMTKKTETIAVMKTLGASRGMILRLYAAVVGVLTLAGALLGLALSAIVAAIFMPLVARFLPVAETLVLDPHTATLAVWYGLLISYLFSLPALLGALHVRPALLFRYGAAHMPLARGKNVAVRRVTDRFVAGDAVYDVGRLAFRCRFRGSYLSGLHRVRRRCFSYKIFRAAHHRAPPLAAVGAWQLASPRQHHRHSDFRHWREPYGAGGADADRGEFSEQDYPCGGKRSAYAVYDGHSAGSS